MRAVSALLLASLTLALTLPARAADPAAPAGVWRLSVPTGEGEDVLFMVALTEQDGKWVGDYLGSSAKLPAGLKVKNLKVDGDVVRFVFDLDGRDVLSFDGVLARDKKKVAGSASLIGRKLAVAEMVPTKLKRLDDPYALAREMLAQTDAGPQLFELATEVLSKAAEKKVPADEVRGVVDRVNKAAAGYGPRWERETTLGLADALAGQDGFADLAVAQAKRAERLLTDDDDAATRLRVLDAVVRTATRAGKAADAKPYTAQVAKLEARDYAEYAKTLPFKPEPFAGRKGKGDRGVLVELFTGAECPPCAAADLAFDGLMKAYPPADVVLLQYHVHVPGPDPLTSPAAMKRLEEYYADQVRGAPTAFVGGKLGPAPGGAAASSGKVFAALRGAIDEALEKPAGVKLGLTVAKAEKGGFTGKATVSGLEAPGDKMMLRFALAEERVRYAGGNGIRYHHMVVRAMPGGAKGFPLLKKDAEQAVTFDPEEVRKELTKYLEEFEKTDDGPFPRPDRPLALRNLKLVAFVQNDATREVLTAVQVDVGEK
jgi:thiol-disulfide isomerase/thioredoxin